MQSTPRLMVLAFFISTTAFAVDFKSDAQKSYDSLAKAVEKRDQRATERALDGFTTNDFSFTDPFGQKHPVTGYAMLLIQLALPNGKDTKRFQILSVKVSGSTATLKLRSQGGNPLMVRTTTDTWVKGGRSWKLKAVTFTAPATSLGIGN